MAALTARPRIHAAAGKALVAPGNGDVWTADQRVVTRLSQGAHSIVQPSTILLSLFSDDGDLMITDRTQTNTQVLYKRAQAGKSSKPEWIAELDGVAIFRAKDATDTTVMFRSDGTPSGTFALTLETGGIKAEASSSPPIRAGSAIYWVRTVGFQRVVYRSRGERDDVKLVFSSSREPIYLQNLNDQLHVLRVQQNVPHSMAWALADDTGKATKILDRPYHISGLATLGDELHWIEHRPSGNHWMRQTQPSSSTVKTFPANSRLAALLSTKSHVFAFVDSDLYSYDGSQNGPQQLARYSNWTSRITTATHLYFPGTDSAASAEPWISDGTRAGTLRLGDLYPGAQPSSPSSWCRVGSSIAFQATTPLGRRLFFTDGTRIGTRPVGSPNQPLLLESGPFAVGSRHALFSAQTANGIHFLRTDGTPTGTRIVPGTTDAEPFDAELVRGQILLPLARLRTGTELYRFWPGATAQVTGLPCAGGDRRPRLQASDPLLGAQLSVTATNLPSGAGRNGVLVMLPPLSRPTPLLGTRCFAHGDWTRLVVLQSFPVSRTTWSFQSPLPNLPALDRLQAILRVVAAPTDGPLFGDLTNAVRLSFGD